MKHTWTAIGLCMVAALAVMAGELDRGSILFYAPLDRTADAEIAAGNGGALPGLNEQRVPGRLGEALVLDRQAWADPDALQMPRMRFTKDIDIYHDYGGPDTVGALRYDAAGNILAEQGTLAVWLKPVNWSSGGSDRFLVNLGMTETLALFYSPYWAYDMFENYAAPDRYTRALNSKLPKFREGQWEHLVIAWRGDRLTWWQNGVRRARESDGVVPLAGATGTLAFGDGSEDATAVDEITILDREVADAEARALFYKLARPAGGGALTLVPDGGNTLVLRGWTSRVLGVSNDDPATVRLTVQDEGLAIRFTCPIPRAFRADPALYVGQPLEHQAPADDAAIFRDDFMAVDLCPGKDTPTYTFAVNGAGTRYDARAADTAWNGDWQSDGKADDQVWTVDVHLPFSLFGEKPEAGSPWGINFRHGGARVRAYDSIWAAVGPQSPPLATLRFAAAAPSVDIATFADPATGDIHVAGRVTGKGLRACAEVDTTCLAEILGADDAYGKLDPTPPPGWQQETTVDGAFAFRHALPDSLAADAVLTLVDAAGTVVYHQRRPFAYAVRWDARLLGMPSYDRALLNVDVGSRSLVERGIGVTVAFRPDGTEEPVLTQEVPRLDEVSQDITIDTRALAPGEYDVDIQFIAGDRPLGALQRRYAKPEPPVWADAGVGLTDEVTPPWTPLERDGGRVACWGRRYDFTNSLLPRQIEILDQDLLAGPITLEINGKTAPATVNWQRETPRRIEWQTAASVDGVRVKMRNWLEFDGFAWFTLEVAGDVAVERLAMTIPFRREIATHWYSGQYSLNDNPTGYLPAERTTFAPRNAVRIGDMNRGLQWVWETEAGWRLRDRDQALVFEPAADAYRATLVFIDTPTDLREQPRELAFGIQALPCKPYPPKGWRELWWAGPWRPEPKRPVYSVMLWNGQENWIMDHHNYPNQTREHLDKMLVQVRHNHEDRQLFHCFKHFDATGDANTPEYHLYGEEWRAEPAPRPNLASAAGNPEKEIWTPVCYGSESYLEWYLYHTRRYLEYMRDNDTLPTMIYIDCTGPVHCSAAHHGHGWIDEEGNRRTSWTVLSQRRYMQRLNQLFHELGENTWITVHMSGNPVMAVWAFADMMMPGEQFASFFQMERARLEREGRTFTWDYTPYMSLDRFRAEFAGRPYGVPQAWLDQRWSAKTAAENALLKKGRNDPQYNVLLRPPYLRGSHHHTALCLVHDVINWGGSSEEAYAMRVRFKWDDQVRFRGYWENQDVLKLDIHDPQRYVCSLAQRPERLLLLPFNNTDADVQATVTLDLEALGATAHANTEAVDLMTGETVPLADGRLTFTMPPRRVRLLCIGPQWEWATENLGPPGR